MMEHRHIDVKPGQWEVAVVHSIWERGSDADIKARIREVKINPEAADAVRRAIPHSQVYGYDIIERPFKILANGCFMISDYVEGLAKLIPNGYVSAKTPEEFEHLLDFYIAASSERWPFATLGKQDVLDSHTYFHRIKQVFQVLNLPQHAHHAEMVYNEVRKQL